MRTTTLLALVLLPVMSHSQHIISEGDTTSILAKYRTKNFSIANPFEGNNLMGHIWEVGRDFVITKVVAVLQGSDSPSVT